MSLSCQMCHASATHLHAYEYVLADGKRLQEVRCMICGWNRQREIPSSRMMREVTDPLPCVVQQLRDRSGGRVSAAVKRMNETPLKAWVPCLLDGCTGLRMAYSKSGLCKDCSNKLGHWHQRGQLTPAPLVMREDGSWMVNQEYVPWGRSRRGKTVGGPK